ncbi:MAG: P1 family peptidase [Candidatus Heimdallarchaeota archaeon]|nr:MAG: P1 family peptidase [Candidatus Heimdallarchaeota archaeon]
MNLRNLGWSCGSYETGQENAITDIPGVKVGNKTIIEGEGALVPGEGPIRTGVTMILPHSGNVFKEKVPAGVFIANGYGKATCISQILETGVIETPIAITNTLNVGLVFNALISHAISENPEIGVKTGSVAPIVTECFDGYLNDIQGRHVKEEHVFEAIAQAKSSSIKQGNIGAGTGMQVFELKSGVGTASRVVPNARIGNDDVYHIGALVTPNFGRFRDFNFYGTEMASILDRKQYLPKADDEWVAKLGGGSIIVIIATDLPLNSRQLNRLAHRGALGIARTGSILSHTSGDFVLAFSTQNKVVHGKKSPFLNGRLLNEFNPLLSDVYRITIDLVQEAIYNAMLAAETMVGRDNNIRVSLDLADLPNPPSI